MMYALNANDVTRFLEFDATSAIFKDLSIDIDLNYLCCLFKLYPMDAFILLQIVYKTK